MQNDIKIQEYVTAAQVSSILQRQIEETKTAIAPLLARLETLQFNKREADSRAFIYANRITLADVEMSSGKGKPWFGCMSDFANWLKTHDHRVWAEWNGRIYHAGDLIAGRMPDMPGTVDHLPND